MCKRLVKEKLNGDITEPLASELSGEAFIPTRTIVGN